MRRSLLVAMDQNGVIGRQGTLPWRLSADLRRFKELTWGHHLLMGRKTLDSIGRILPGRQTIVVTRNPGWRPAWLKPTDSLQVATSLDEAFEQAMGDDEPFIIGGGEIYQLALPIADRIYLTRVEAVVAGDTFFPELSLNEWRLVSTERHGADEKNEYDYRFEILDRVK